MVGVMPDPEYLTTAQIAETFDVDASTVSRWVQLDRIPTAGRFGAGRTAPVMFDAAVITTWGKALRDISTTSEAA